MYLMKLWNFCRPMGLGIWRDLETAGELFFSAPRLGAFAVGQRWFLCSSGHWRSSYWAKGSAHGEPNRTFSYLSVRYRLGLELGAKRLQYFKKVKISGDLRNCSVDYKAG